jgi:CubicO group peptidase (beta-lactamase class C family)
LNGHKGTEIWRYFGAYFFMLTLDRRIHMNRICRSVLLFCCVVLLIACSDSSDNPTVEPTYAQTIAETKAFIRSLMDERNIVGLSIALVDAEMKNSSKLIWAQGFGLADKEVGKQASEDTIYCIGSTSKTVTAVALLNQMDAGRIDLDQPIQTYIPDFSLEIRYPGINQNDRITPRTLLNMHAGVPGDLYNGLFIISPPWYGTYMNWLLSYLQGDYPSHPPQTLASYGNTGILLAGHAAYLVGREDGADEDRGFQDFVKRTVFDPLDMTATFSEVVGQDLPDLATPYNGGVPDMLLNTNGTATGGFYSSVIDMSKFLTMLLMDGMLENGERLLKADSVREMGKSSRTQLDTGSFYQPGLGLDSISLSAFYGVAPDQGAYGRAWAKNGSTGPYNAMIMLLPDTGLKLGVVVLSNSDTAGSAVFTVARTCLLAAVREKLGLFRNPEPKPLPDFSEEAITDDAEIVGLYGAGSPTAYFQIEKRDTGLFWVTNPYQNPTSGHALALKTDGSNAYAVEGRNWDVVFINREDIYGNQYRLMVRTGGEEEVPGPNVVSTLGQKISIPEELPQGWQDRVGKIYLADLMIALGSDPFLTFDYKNGLLLAQTPTTMHVIYPQNDILAFVGDTMSRGDGAITVTREDDVERLFYLLSGYFPVEQVEGYALGEEAQFDIVLRNEVPLSLWRKFTVAQGSEFDGQKVGFAVTPGNALDVYVLYDEGLEMLDMGVGEGAVFPLKAGTYYLAFNPAVDSSGEKVLFSGVVD